MNDSCLGFVSENQSAVRLFTSLVHLLYGRHLGGTHLLFLYKSGRVSTSNVTILMYVGYATQIMIAAKTWQGLVWSDHGLRMTPVEGQVHRSKEPNFKSSCGTITTELSSVLHVCSYLAGY